MGKEIAKLEPQKLWNNFYNLTQIPRPSKKEERIIAFVEKFGIDLGLETIVDQTGNVIIRKPATKGFENRQGVILQGHLDMVPQKNSDTIHDFEADPIQAYIEGEWVTAKGTTLGADNGIGAAAAMAILESNDIEHGPIEALFTIDEETGMTGATELKPNFLKGDILINLDSEDEGELYIGCAGGINTTAIFNYSEENPKENYKSYRIAVKGLKGGHSGLDIILKRGNANLIMNKILIKANEHFGIMLSEIEGGNLRNAIPREAFALVAIPQEKDLLFIKLVKEIKAQFLDVLTDDEGLSISLEEIDMPKKFIDTKTTTNLLNSISICPNGVIKMIDALPDVVETSSNLAVVKSENGQIKVLSLQRSSSEEAKNKLCVELKELFEEYNAKVIQDGDYPGWNPNPDSDILSTMKNVYLENFGKTPEVKVIHAGLECGILGATYPNWDMISFGPTIRFPHSPDEKVNIKSVDMFWKYLIETLKNIPVK
ncbi:MAG: aminoacyl-histidine dipeptidase [Bacteroidales bacterium]|nr:aminoacyl-histidine dipeptidase [Bacteroidales bacterium]MBN2755640.1 aminoacyl-histidine dipeptidase [Bacteroidales bacterium]